MFFFCRENQSGWAVCEAFFYSIWQRIYACESESKRNLVDVFLCVFAPFLIINSIALYSYGSDFKSKRQKGCYLSFEIGIESTLICRGKWSVANAIRKITKLIKIHCRVSIDLWFVALDGKKIFSTFPVDCLRFLLPLFTYEQIIVRLWKGLFNFMDESRMWSLLKSKWHFVRLPVARFFKWNQLKSLFLSMLLAFVLGKWHFFYLMCEWATGKRIFRRKWLTG